MTAVRSSPERTVASVRVELDRRRPLVVVAPHPDDEIIGFGGAMYDHAAAGGRVVVVTVTDGEAFDPRVRCAPCRRNAAVRREEQTAALDVLGIPTGQLHRLGLPDGGVDRRVDELAAALGEVFMQYGHERAPIVVAPWREDLHPDHVATNRAVRLARYGEGVLEVPIWSWHARRLGPPSWSRLAVVRISGAAQHAKRDALRCHRSQFAPLDGGRPAILSATFAVDFDRPFEVLCE